MVKYVMQDKHNFKTCLNETTLRTDFQFTNKGHHKVIATFFHRTRSKKARGASNAAQTNRDRGKVVVQHPGPPNPILVRKRKSGSGNTNPEEGTSSGQRASGSSSSSSSSTIRQVLSSTAISDHMVSSSGVSSLSSAADSSDEEEEDVVEVPVMRPKSPPPRTQRKCPRSGGDSGPSSAAPAAAAEEAMDIGEPLMHSANSLEPTPSTSSNNAVSELRAFRRTSNVAVQSNMGDASETPNVLDELKASLECPVCSRLSLPPLMACRNGHVTCNACRPKVTSCPICREAEIDSRNMLLEKAFAYLTIPCEYAPHGCQVEIPYRDKESVSGISLATLDKPLGESN